MGGPGGIEDAKVRLLQAKADLAVLRAEQARASLGRHTRCVFCVLPQGWGWLPVAELDPLCGVEGEWIPNELLMPSQPGSGASDGEDGDPLPPFGALLERGLRQIPTDVLKDLFLAHRPVGPHVVGDAGLGIPPQVTDRR